MSALGTRACGQSSCGDERGDEVEVHAVACVGFVVAGRDAPEFLDLGEIVLDQVAPFIHLLIIVDLLFSVAPRRDDGAGAALVQFRAQAIGIECLVAQQGIEADIADQGRDADHVMALAGQEHEADQIPQGIDEGDNFGGQAAPRSPDGLILSPPFAPLAFW